MCVLILPREKYSVSNFIATEFWVINYFRNSVDNIHAYFYCKYNRDFKHMKSRFSILVPFLYLIDIYLWRITFQCFGVCFFFCSLKITRLCRKILLWRRFICFLISVDIVGSAIKNFRLFWAWDVILMKINVLLLVLSTATTMQFISMHLVSNLRRR